MWRLILLVLGLAFAVALPFAIWGEHVEAVVSVDGAVAAIRDSSWGPLAGVGLIVSDVVLPVPSTAVMAALGVVYGPLVGGALAAAGSLLAGSLGYGLCRALGPRVAERLAGREGLEEARRLFGRWGFGLVAISRWVPVLPETVAFLAGLTAMPFPRFLAALATGCVPLGFLFATLGHYGREAPLAVMVLAALLPLGLAALVRWWRHR